MNQRRREPPARGLPGGQWPPARTPAVLGLAVVVAALVVSLRRPLLEALRLLARSEPGALRAWVLSFGVWAPLASAALMILQAVVAPLPSSPVTYVNGLVFGTWWGGLLSWASALGAAALCFGLSRRLGRPLVERLVGRRAVQWSDAFFIRFGTPAVFLGRLLPVISFDVISYGAGLTRMSFPGFLGATAVGMIPGTLLYSYLGHLGGSSGQALVWTLAGLTALGVFVLALRPRVIPRLVGGTAGLQGGRGRTRTAVVRTLARMFTRWTSLGRLWARWAPIPVKADVLWTPLTRPLRECTATLVTTAGVHLRGDTPFDMTDRDGDPTFRRIPADATAADLRITHDYYDHRDADRDVNIVFPLERFRELVADGVLDGLTPSHWSFMGHVDGPLVHTLETVTVPALLERLLAERPDLVFLTPA